MKVIDLLNKIANGESVPEKIIYKNEIREYVYDDRDYINPDSNNYYLFFNIMRKGKGVDFANALNDKVEIIKDVSEDTPKEDKKIEKFKVIKDNSGDSVELIYKGMKLELTLLQAIALDKLNEIIDKINGGYNE